MTKVPPRLETINFTTFAITDIISLSSSLNIFFAILCQGFIQCLFGDEWCVSYEHLYGFTAGCVILNGYVFIKYRVFFPCLWCCHNEMMMMKERDFKDSKSMMIQVKSSLS